MSDISTPLVSIYIANHNYGRYIDQAIRSALAQSLPNFELIVIDDGSTDNSREIIESYRDHPRVIPIFQHNQGLTVTNNIALRASRGKYIMRLDADDWLDPHILEVLSNVLERNPDVGMVFPDYYHVDPDGTVIEVVRRHDFGEVTLRDQPAHGACTMIRRQCLLDLDGYDESLRCQDGYDLWVRFIEKFQVRNVNLPLFYYRQHGESLTRNEDRILDTRSTILRRHAALKDRKRRVLAIVPVRGSVVDPSSSVLRTLGEQPLIDWTLNAALESHRVTDVVVTTPDDAVIFHVRAVFGERVIVIKRDSRLAAPNTYIEETLLDALARYRESGRDADAVFFLMVESPFRTARHLDSAVDIMELFETDCVVGVRPDNDLFYQHNGAGLVPLRKNPALRLEREELFRQTGGMVLVTVEHLMTMRRILSGRLGHVILDQRASHSLKTSLDWQIGEALARTQSST